MPENMDKWASGNRKIAKSGHRVAAEMIPSPRRWHGSMISADPVAIWRMSVEYALGTDRTQGHRDRSPALKDMHGHDLLTKAVVVLGAAEVELADCSHSMALVTNTVHPARNAAAIRGRVIPVTRLMRVTTSRQRRTSRTAQRTGAIGVGKTRAVLSNPVERRRLNYRVSIAAERTAVMVVTQEEDQIGRLDFGHWPLLGSPVPPIRESAS